jgi:hypothetical protein
VDLGSFIARVRIDSFHDVGGTVVVRLELLEEVKGSHSATTVYLPVDEVWRPDGQPVEEKQTALLVAGPDATYRATRQFWHDVDELRGEDPVVERVVFYWLPFVEDRLMVPVDIDVPWAAEVDAPEAAPPNGWRLVSSEEFMRALADAVAGEQGRVAATEG